MYPLYTLLCMFPFVDGFNYLVISPVNGFSHMKFMANIANQLADGGHNVTFFQPFALDAYHNHTLITNPSINIFNYYHDKEGLRHLPSPMSLSDAWDTKKYQSGLMSVFDMPKVLFGMWEHMCRRMFEDTSLHDTLKSQGFDVVFAETFDFCGLYLSDYLGFRSVVSVFTGSRLLAITAPLGEPSWLHYFPAPGSDSYGPGAGILNRINDLYYKYVFGYGYVRLFDRQFQQVSQLTNGKVRHWKKILKDVTFHFSNSNPYLDFPIPSISKIIPIGGFDMGIEQKPHELSPELNSLLDSRPVTIFVSFGSMVKSKFMPDHYKSSMLKFFAANSQHITFLWKYEDLNDKLIKDNLPDNVFLGEWFPQTALLADKRVKLFITHGGLASTMELAYAAKPAIVIPLIAEQPDNANMLSRHGSVEVFSKFDIPNWQKLHDLTLKMLHTESYQLSADRLALVLANQPISPKDLMIRHAEMAAKFGRMPELTPRVMDMGIVEFHNLDIVLLVIGIVIGVGHMKCMAAIANQLADAGHEVTFFQPFVVELFQNHDLLKNPNIEVMNYWHDEEGHRNMPSHSVLSDAWYSNKYQSDLAVRFLVPSILHDSFEHMCRKMFQDKDLHETLKNKKFDVVISETFDFCGLYLADYLEMPAIISVFTGSKLNAITNAIGEPSFLHYFPSPSSSIGPDLSIYDRFNNLWHKILSSGAFGGLFDRQHQSINKLVGGKVRHWTQILNDVTYHFSNSNPYLDFVQPTIPKVVPIGGYTMDYTEVPPVSKELDEILNKRPYTVFISYGSMVASEYMPDEYKRAMIKLFEHNKNVTFLWKYENPEEPLIKENIPENVHLSKWFPQQSLLADKRVNLFITHGGLGSTMELAYAAKPAIVTPLFADQPSNAQMLSRHGSVELYSKFDIPDWEKQSDLLRRMLTDERYQIAATRLAEILLHQPISPKEIMVRHSENAARFGKMPTLTPFAKDMGYIEFYNLDIIFYMFSLLLFVIYGVIEIYGIVTNRCIRKVRKDKVQ